MFDLYSQWFAVRLAFVKLAAVITHILGLFASSSLCNASWYCCVDARDDFHVYALHLLLCNDFFRQVAMRRFARVEREAATKNDRQRRQLSKKKTPQSSELVELNVP